MKKSVIAVLALSLMLIAPVASAYENTLIGVFADDTAVLCAADFPVYDTTFGIYAIAVLGDTEEYGAITAAEFIIQGLPDPTGMAILSYDWASDLVIGNVFGDGFSIAFPVPLPGPVIVLGRIGFFVLDASWPETNTILCVTETLDSGNLVLVDDSFVTHHVDGWCFVANCVPTGIPGDGIGNCECLDSIPTADTNWGAVKALY